MTQSEPNEMKITGASVFLNRISAQCGQFQWAREFLKNAIEAGATKVVFGLERQGAERSENPVYRRIIIDNGCGMLASELVSYYMTIGMGAKKVGGVHDNFAMGAKIASMFWNPLGIVVVSYRNGRGAMIDVRWDTERERYVQMVLPNGQDIADPETCDWSNYDGVDYGKLKPDWLTDHGTIILLRGSEQQPDTMLGNPDKNEAPSKALISYLNNRFWDLTGLDVRVTRLSGVNREEWIKSRENGGLRQFQIQARGARYQIEHGAPRHPESDTQDAYQSGSVMLDSGQVEVMWFLHQPDLTTLRHSEHEIADGYVAAIYHEELYPVENKVGTFRNFGVFETSVRKRLRLVVRLPLYSPGVQAGVFPNDARSALFYNGPGLEARPLSLDRWGTEFSQLMPDEIRRAIAEARSDSPSSVDNPELRERLLNRFGSRWLSTGLALSEEGKNATSLASRPSRKPRRADPTRKTKQRIEQFMRGEFGDAAAESGDRKAKDKPTKLNIPRWQYAENSEFENGELASWVRNHPNGPTVMLNQDSPILSDLIKRCQESYPDTLVERVATVVMDTFGTNMVCRIAHIHFGLGKDNTHAELDATYLSDNALTSACFGFYAEEALVAQVLKRELGRGPSL